MSHLLTRTLKSAPIYKLYVSYILYNTIRSEVYPGYFQDDLFKKDISSLIERVVQTLFEGQMSKIQGTIRNFITLMAHLK